MEQLKQEVKQGQGGGTSRDISHNASLNSLYITNQEDTS